MRTSPARTLPLSVPRATALYIGALFGPGLLLLPGLAAEQAGPASIIAWLALLGLSAIFAVVFAALGKAVPGAAGAAGYVAAGLGRRASAATRWWFLAGVIAGAPIVCLIGASYVTVLTGGGPLVRAAIAAGLLLAVLGLALGGVRASAVAQLLLVALLIVVVVTAVAGSAPAARPANWTPFAPHGWLSVGRAASTLMLSFVGWEAVAPLTGRLRAGQLSRVIGIAFSVTAVLYLGLAIATVSCLGRGANLAVPLADLLQLALPTSGGRPAGRWPRRPRWSSRSARSTPTCSGRPRCCASSAPYAVKLGRTVLVIRPGSPPMPSSASSPWPAWCSSPCPRCGWPTPLPWSACRPRCSCASTSAAPSRPHAC